MISSRSGEAAFGQAVLIIFLTCVLVITSIIGMCYIENIKAVVIVIILDIVYVNKLFLKCKYLFCVFI